MLATTRASFLGGCVIAVLVAGWWLLVLRFPSVTVSVSLSNEWEGQVDNVTVSLPKEIGRMRIHASGDSFKIDDENGQDAGRVRFTWEGARGAGPEDIAAELRQKEQDCHGEESSDSQQVVYTCKDWAGLVTSLGGSSAYNVIIEGHLSVQEREEILHRLKVIPAPTRFE